MSNGGKRKRTSSTPTKKPAFKRQKINFINPPQSNFKRIEKKNFDATSTATVVFTQTTAVVLQIFTPDQGTAPTEHVGRRVQATSLAYKWTGSMLAGGQSPLRMVIIYDRQSNAATPTTVTVFNTDVIGTFTNLANSKRFTVVVDETISSIGNTGDAAWMITGYRKLNLPTEFNEVNGGTIADITSGSYIAFFWQNGGLLTTSPTNSFTSRIRYTDM